MLRTSQDDDQRGVARDRFRHRVPGRGSGPALPRLPGVVAASQIRAGSCSRGVRPQHGGPGARSCDKERRLGKDAGDAFPRGGPATCWKPAG